MLQHVRDKVFPFLKDLNGAESNFTHHMKTQYSLSQSQHCWWRQWRPLTKSSRWWKGILKKKAKLFKTFKEMYMNSCCRKSPPQARTANFAHHATLLNWWQIWSSRNWDNVLPTLPAVRGFLLGAYQYILTQLSLSQNLKRDNSKGSTHDEDGFFRTSVTAALTKRPGFFCKRVCMVMTLTLLWCV